MKSPLGRLEFRTPHYQDKIYTLVKAEAPHIVVETGLWEGLGAEYILKAMDEVDRGHLYSIDPMDPNQRFNGVRGRPELWEANPIVHPRFTLIREYSQKALEPLYLEIGQFDMFIHDSDHSHECQSFEYEAAWRMVRSGGIIASDDVAWGDPPHRAWHTFLERHGLVGTVIGNAQWTRKP